MGQAQTTTGGAAAVEGAGLALRAEGLVKAYGSRRALDDVSVIAGRGERLGVIGANGAGKTTLLQILAGALAPTAGRVEVRGRIGWVPQQPALYTKLSARENLRLFARLERVGDPDAVVGRMLDQTGLAQRADEEVGRLSGGNRQRLNVAIGLLAEPDVLLLDEPTSSLDPRQRAVLWEFVGQLADAGTTVVFSTHHVNEAHRYADRLLVLAGGRAVFDGTETELRASVKGPAEDFEAAFVALLAERGG